MVITGAGRRGGSYYRRDLKDDILYGHFCCKDVALTANRKTCAVTSVADGMARAMESRGLLTPAQRLTYEQTVRQRLTPICQYDDLAVEALYGTVHALRKELLGTEVLEQYRDCVADCAFAPKGIDQSEKRDQLLQEAETVIFALCDMSMLRLLQEDLHAAQGKNRIVLCSEQTGNILPTRQWFSQRLAPVTYCSQLDRLPEDALLLFYGEEGLLHCRDLRINAMVYAKPVGFFARAVTGQLAGKEDCLVFVPKGFDITPYVPITRRTRISYWQLAQLWQTYGDGIYDLSVEELYARYPQYFLNIYQSGNGCPEAEADYPIQISGGFENFEEARDRAIKTYLDSFADLTYDVTYFDEELTQKPVCYDPSQTQRGILVHALRVKKSENAQVVSCHVPLRQEFTGREETAVLTNFLFFMTPRLGRLYNELRADRPLEQADAADGHLDYMLCYENGKRIETFPLFRKSCIAMKQDGSFLFFNFRLGGGQVRINGQTIRWEASMVDSDAEDITVYTPYASVQDADADRNTYRKAVGAGKVNFVILRDKLCAVRRGNVILPSVGVVISLEEARGMELIARLGLNALENGYYDVSGLDVSIHLDAPEQVDPVVWSTVKWAYGGGLSLILEGKGLCDGDDTDLWFTREGWMSPLSRQTQESGLHTMAKHPRTALGVTQNGDTVLLVYSGRTWRSTGADYREMIQIARVLFPDIHSLMNMDGGGSAVMGMVAGGSFMELSCPSTSSDSTVGMVRPVNTVLYIPAGHRRK